MSTLNRDIQVLNLTRNSISLLKSREFYEKKFGNLQKLYLSSNQIDRIEGESFYKLIGLVELDLSENLLKSFELVDNQLVVNPISSYEDTSQDNENATNEDLVKVKPQEVAIQYDKQQSRRFTRSFLEHLASLRHLNLNSNQLQTIGPHLFGPLVQLRQLYLSK